MMRKQNKGSDFLPMQTRKNSELSIILTSLIFHCELARINFCPPRSSTGKWVVLRRELGGNAVDGKSVAVGIGVGYQEDPRWAKKSTPPVRGGFWKTTWAVLYLQAILKAHVKFQKDRPKTVGGVKGTRYLLPIHFCYIRTQKMSKLKMRKKW